MKTMVITEPTKATWRSFCNEPELTPQELGLWAEIKQLVRRNVNFREFIYTHAPKFAEAPQTKSWADMVERADRTRQFVRQHFPLYEQWKGR